MELKLESLLSEERVRQYVTYEGSLTQPPCSENVVWVLANRPLYLSVRQLELLRNVAEHENGLAHNWRPVQPVGKRCVRTNIQFQTVNFVHSFDLFQRKSNFKYLNFVATLVRRGWPTKHVLYAIAQQLLRQPQDATSATKRGTGNDQLLTFDL